MKWLACAGWLSLALALIGCGTLPAREPLLLSSALAPDDVATTPLARVAAASTPFAAQGRSGFRLLTTGEYAFDARAALVEAAQRSIDAQYYHVHGDTAGVAFLHGLRDAARRGVRVPLLVDDYHAGEAFPLLLALNAEPGAEVRLFNPLLARAGSPLARLLWSWQDFDRAQRRMHNKLFVVDNTVAVFGGRNVADEYFWRHSDANFIDLDLLAIGPVVSELSASFDSYWNSPWAWRADRVPGIARSAEPDPGLLDRRAAELPLTVSAAPTDPLGQTPVRQQLRSGTLHLRWGAATVHADPPNKITDPVVLYQPTLAMRAKLEVIAQANDEVIIVNPYLVPDKPGMQLMIEAARKNVRGIVFTNSLGSTDEPLAHRAYSRYRRDMLQLGLQLYELKPVQPALGGDFGDFGKSIGRLHVKGAAVDRRWLLVGSVNLDGRSAILNTELAVNIDCPALVADALAALGREPWHTMYRVTLAADGHTLQWRDSGADGRVEILLEKPGDSALLRAWHQFQSLFVEEVML
jgi:putative cardiolipin synthase